jgi:hypothetical protein
MRINSQTGRELAGTSVLILSFILSLTLSAVSYAADMKPEDIVAKHLDSIGTAQARASAKSRVVEGTVNYKLLVGGAGNLDGKAVLVSQDQKVQFMVKLNNNLYRGEQFIYDGNKDQVALTTANHTRSSFGEFVRVQDTVLREGLIGGTLSTAWPLYDLNDRKAKLSYEGMKKIDGKDLYQLRYKPKKSTDADIYMYFDPQTFHHVLTVYTIRIRAGLGSEDPQLANASPLNTGDAGPGQSPTNSIAPETSETRTAHQQETRYRLEEHFDGYQTANGLTLPTQYTIHFSQELANGHTTVSEWMINASQITNGDGVDPRNFEVK